MCNTCGNEHTGDCPPLPDHDYANDIRDEWGEYENDMA